MNSKASPSANLGVSQLSEGVHDSTNTLDEDVRSQQFEESFIFPLFSEISRVTNIPSIICAIQLIIQIIQSLIANMFIGNLHIWKSISSTPKVFRYLSYIINFGVIDLINQGNSGNKDNLSKDNFFNCWPVYVVVIIFIGIEIILILTLMFYYRKKRLFIKWTLYIANFIFSILNSIIFAPTCGIFGYAVWQVDLHRSASSIVYLIISIIPALILLILIIYNNNFACHSIYISRSIDSCWDARVRYLFTLSIGLSSFLAPALNPFKNWFVFVGFIAILVFIGNQLFLLHYLPYIRGIMNSFIQSACLLSISCIVLSIAHYFVDINSYILIFIPISIFVIFCIIFYFYNKYRVNSLLKKMDSSDESNTEEDKKKFLDLINNGSENTVIFYARIGITYMSKIFVDYSIMKYIVSVRQSPRIMFALIHLTAMIPAQMQFLSMIISNVSANTVFFTTSQKFVLYQTRKVTVTRQSVSSKEERSEAKMLYKTSEETISLVRGFWGEISHLKSDISTASLRYFRNATNRTSSSYLDALEQYPRSQKIYDQYIRFLIEAKGDYRESIKYRKNLIVIEKGNKVVHDYAFRSFANAFPKYLTEKVLDTHGMYINKDDQLQANDQFMTSGSSQRSTSTMGLSNTYHDDEISTTIFDHSKLRLALQDVINRSSMSSLNTLRFYSIITFLLIFLVMIILMIIITSTTTSLHSLVKSITLTSKILSSIQYTGLLIGSRIIEYSTQTYSIIESLGQEHNPLYDYFCFHSKIICDTLSIDNSSLPQEPSLYKDPLIKLNMIAQDIRSYLREEMNIIYSNPSLHIGEISLFSEWSMNSSHQAYYDVITGFQFIILSASLHEIINMATRQIEFISSTNASNYFDMPFILNSDFYTMACVNDIYISDGFDSIFANISQKGIDDCDRRSNIYDILTYIISVAAVFIFFVFRLVNFFYVKSEFKNLSSILRAFNKDDIAAASKPIYLKSKEALPTGTVHSAHDFSLEIYMIPVLYLLITADCIIITVYSCLQTQNYFDTYSNVFVWSNSAACRSSSILQLINKIHFDYFYIRIDLDSFEYANLSESIEKITKYHNTIDMEIIGKDSRFDKFYYFDDCKSLNDFGFAEYADCLSVSNKINSAINMLINIDNLYFDPENYDMYGLLNPEELTNNYDYTGLMYSLDKSIFTEFISFMDYLNTFADKISEENNNQIQTICIIGIIILVLLFLIENIFITMLYNSLEGFKQLIYTLPPVSVCRNRPLILFLSNRKMKEDFMSTTDLVLNSSQFAIITINENFIIQTINQEFCKLTDYSTQKLLGQSITYLIPLPHDGNGNILLEKSTFYSSINEMRENINNNDSYSVKIKMRKEDLSIVHLNANLIKISDSSNSFKGVTILLKSSEENYEMKNRLEQEKMNVNNLIKVLIPRGAMNTVKGKKQSVFFSSDEATLISLEITGMADCISMMSPKGILDILQQIYNGIDRALRKFKTISMLRWENEMIFGVSGLFDTVGDFRKQAFETAAFLIEILQSLEETNIQSNTDFHFRLSAHIGGPVMGFIQDLNNPYFDILSYSFKYLNYMKENGPIDRPWVTESFVKHLDLSAFDIKKEATFTFDDNKEDIYSFQYKDGFRLPEEYLVDEDLNGLQMSEEEVKIPDDELNYDHKSVSMDEGETAVFPNEISELSHIVEPQMMKDENDDDDIKEEKKSNENENNNVENIENAENSKNEENES